MRRAGDLVLIDGEARPGFASAARRWSRDLEMNDLVVVKRMRAGAAMSREHFFIERNRRIETKDPVLYLQRLRGKGAPLRHRHHRTAAK